MARRKIDYAELDDYITNTDLSINAIARTLNLNPSTVCRRARRIGVDRFNRSFNKGGRPRKYLEMYASLKFADPFWTPQLRPLEGLSGYINNGS